MILCEVVSLKSQRLVVCCKGDLFVIPLACGNSIDKIYYYADFVKQLICRPNSMLFTRKSHAIDIYFNHGLSSDQKSPSNINHGLPSQLL